MKLTVICPLLLFTLLGIRCGTAFSSDALKTQGSFDLQRTFATVRLNEKDLTKLVDILNQLPKKFGGSIEIKVISGDGEETVKTTDPKYFSSSDMLTYICAVTIGYQQFDAPVSATLMIGSSYDWGRSGTTLEVSGSDQVAVFGIFRELERELALHQAAIDWFGAGLSLYRFSVILVLGVLLGAVGAYSVYLVLVKLVARFASSAQLEGVSATFILMAFIVCSVGSIWLLHACFGPVQFSGALSDPSRAVRSYFTSIVVLFFLPIGVNIVSALFIRSQALAPTEAAEKQSGERPAD